MININKIEECAKHIQLEEKVGYKESIYFAIGSLLTFINSQPNLNRTELLKTLNQVVNENYPDFNNLVERYKNGFDLIEHIAYNAKRIQDTENKDRNEALYLTLCMVYDDFIERNSKNGISDLMYIIDTIYPNLKDEVLTYVAWKYQPQLAFKSEFDEYMRRRHSK